jgi:DNA-binding CsgD family transcriptional regulator
MGFREVTMEEVREVLLLWLDGVPKKRIARQLRMGPPTVRRYIAAAPSLRRVRRATYSACSA